MWNSRLGKPLTPLMSTCGSSFLERTLTPLEMEERTYLIDKSNLLLVLTCSNIDRPGRAGTAEAVLPQQNAYGGPQQSRGAAAVHEGA